MTLSGWLFLCCSWALIIGICAACMVKVLRTQSANIRAPLEIDTGDLNNAPREPEA